MVVLLRLVACCVGLSSVACRNSGSANSHVDAGFTGTVVRWSVSQPLFGTETFVANADGGLRYRLEPAGGKPKTAGSATVRPQELKTLARKLAELDCCDLESGRSGIPDEGKPSLTIRLSASNCTVSLWDGEWRKVPAAKACLEAIKPLMVKAAGKPAPQGM